MLGETVSHYRITKKLGQGGMGEVWLAEDTRLERKVALKFLAPELARDRASRVRFLNEAKAAADLSHPNIASIYDVGEADGKPFLALEFVEGQTLRERIEQGPLSIEEVLRIGVDLANGLGEAHAHGIVHRDIKSSNVIVTDRGQAKILDFGLAHRGDATRITRSGTTLGTIAYMSPEQARGEVVDERSDIWSLGVVLYECATGSLPFGSDRDAAIVHRILSTNPDPPSRLRKELPAGLDTVLDSALAKTRNERYAKTGDLLSDLLDLQAGLAPPARRPHRRPWSRWTLGAGAAAALAAVLYWSVPALRTPVAETESAASGIVRNAIAVLPFAVRGAADDLGLGEGMVDLLSSKLDGAGSIRSVDPRGLLTYIRQNEVAASDLGPALATARHFNAGMCIMGDVFQSSDRVHINAALYESDGDTTPLSTASAEGQVSSILALVDQLAAQLLKDHSTQEGVGDIGLESMTTSSFPALKAYLAGESAYRKAMHGDLELKDQAREEYLRAVELDSTFALAWYGLAQLEGSGYGGSADLAAIAIERALAYGDRLSEHDLLHVRGLRAEIDDDLEGAERIYQTLLGLAPDCFDAVKRLSDIRHEQGWRRGHPLTQGRQLVERGLTLEPDNRDLQYRMAWINVMEGNWADAETWFRRTRDGNLSIAEQVYIGYAVHNAEIKATAHEVLSPLDLGVQINAILHVANFTDDLEGAEDLATMFTVGENSDEVKAMGHLILAHLEVASGRWEGAKAELEKVAAIRPDLAIESKALLAAHPFLAVPETERRQIRDELAAWDADASQPSVIRITWIASHDKFHPLFKTYLSGVLDVGLGAYESGLESAKELEAIVCAPPDTLLGLDLAQALRGFAAMQQGELQEAVDEFSRATFQVSFAKQVGSNIHSRSLERFERARALAGLGRLEEARSWLECFAWSLGYEYIYRAPAQLEMARISEQLGETGRALDHYSQFIGFWKHCEPRLRPIVAEAEQRVLELSSAR